MWRVKQKDVSVTDATHRALDYELRLPSRIRTAPVVSEEGCVAPTLLLRQNVNLGLKAGVGAHGAGLHHELPAADVVSLDAAQEQTHVVARLSVRKQVRVSAIVRARRVAVATSVR